MSRSFWIRLAAGLLLAAGLTWALGGGVIAFGGRVTGSGSTDFVDSIDGDEEVGAPRDSESDAGATVDRSADRAPAWRPRLPGTLGEGRAIRDGHADFIVLVGPSSQERAGCAWRLRISADGEVFAVSPSIPAPPWFAVAVELPTADLSDLRPPARAALVDLLSAWSGDWPADARAADERLLALDVSATSLQRQSLLRWRRGRAR